MKMSNSSRKRREGSEHQFNATFFPSVANASGNNLSVRKMNGTQFSQAMQGLGQTAMQSINVTGGGRRMDTEHS